MRSDAKVITINELSEYLRVHRSTLYRLLKKGDLPGFKIGSDWRFNIEAIDTWRIHQSAGLDGQSGDASEARSAKQDRRDPS
jgi:excisionase family DNA binding protein